MSTATGTDVGVFEGAYELDALVAFFNKRGFGPVELDSDNELRWLEGSKPELAGDPSTWVVERVL